MEMDWQKSVDESWKESAAQEKERLESITRTGKPGSASARPAGPGATHESRRRSSPADAVEETPSNANEEDFINYITSLAFQAMIFLGEIPNPVTNEPEENLQQAKFVIDTLILLQEKTKGNLTKKETDVLNTAAYELQMKYVETAHKKEAA